MSTTNRKNLPEPILDAINNRNDHTPVPNGIPFKRIIEPPQMLNLIQHHGIDDDVSDKIWMLISKAIVLVIQQGNDTAHTYRSAQHTVNKMRAWARLELSANPQSEEALNIRNATDHIISWATKYYPIDSDRWIVNRKMAIPVAGVIEKEPFPVDFNKDVYDTIDLYDKDTGSLYLVSTTTVASVKDASRLNPMRVRATVQKMILQYNGYEVNSIQAAMIFKDFSNMRSKTTRDTSYPTSQMICLPLTPHPVDKVMEMLIRRVSIHVRADEGDVVECTPQDRWKEADSYKLVKVTKEGAVMTIKKGLMSKADIEEYQAKNIARVQGAVVEIDFGQNRRCEMYCKVRDYCNQFKRIKELEYNHKTKQL